MEKSLTEAVRHQVLVELNTRTGGSYSASMLNVEYNRLRKKWSAFKGLLTETGCGWNSELRTVDLPPSKLDDFKAFQENGLDRYEDMNEMWSKGTATGCFARSSSNKSQMSTTDEKEQMCKAFARVGGTSRRCKSSRTVYTNEPRCKSQFTVETNMIQSPDTITWSVNQCLAHVCKMDGVTIMHIDNARSQFVHQWLRTVYMNLNEAQ